MDGVDLSTQNDAVPCLSTGDNITPNFIVAVILSTCSYRKAAFAILTLPIWVSSCNIWCKHVMIEMYFVKLLI